MKQIVRRTDKGKLAFDGFLADPIFIGPRHLRHLSATAASSPLSFDDLELAGKERVIEERMSKLRALADFLSPPQKPDWLFVAYFLACEFVPGFALSTSPKRRVGRPRKPFGGVGAESDFSLSASIDGIVRDNKVGISRACELLTKRNGPWRGRPATTLETRYHRHKKFMQGFTTPEGKQMRDMIRIGFMNASRMKPSKPGA